MAYDIFEEYEVEELLGKNFKRKDFNFVYDDWLFERGAYLVREYFHRTEGNLVIRELYVYEWQVESDGLKRKITKATHKAEWLNPDGTVGHSEVLKVKDKKQQLKRLNRDVRTNQIDSLEVSGENLADLAETIPVEVRGIEPYKTQYETLVSISNNIFTLLRHYGADITNYKGSGDPILEMRIRNETNIGIKNILDFVPPLFPGEKPDEKFPNGRSIGQAILYQMTGETEI